jgi:hypothetical protein
MGGTPLQLSLGFWLVRVLTLTPTPILTLLATRLLLGLGF